MDEFIRTSIARDDTINADYKSFTETDKLAQNIIHIILNS